LAIQVDKCMPLRGELRSRELLLIDGVREGLFALEKGRNWAYEGYRTVALLEI